MGGAARRGDGVGGEGRELPRPRRGAGVPGAAAPPAPPAPRPAGAAVTARRAARAPRAYWPGYSARPAPRPPIGGAAGRRGGTRRGPSVRPRLPGAGVPPPARPAPPQVGPGPASRRSVPPAAASPPRGGPAPLRFRPGGLSRPLWRRRGPAPPPQPQAAPPEAPSFLSGWPVTAASEPVAAAPGLSEGWAVSRGGLGLLGWAGGGSWGQPASPRALGAWRCSAQTGVWEFSLSLEGRRRSAGLWFAGIRGGTLCVPAGGIPAR